MTDEERAVRFAEWHGGRWDPGDEDRLAAEFAAVRKEALERACCASCYWCAEGAGLVNMHPMPGVWHRNPNDPAVSSKCEAAAIRSLVESK
jgi:hypothetical protein